MEPKVSERARLLSRGIGWRKPNAKLRSDEQEPDMRCDAFETSGHVTTKSSIHGWDAFYKSGVYAATVMGLTPRDLSVVREALRSGRPDLIDGQRSAEGIVGRYRDVRRPKHYRKRQPFEVLL